MRKKRSEADLKTRPPPQMTLTSREKMILIVFTRTVTDIMKQPGSKADLIRKMGTALKPWIDKYHIRPYNAPTTLDELEKLDAWQSEGPACPKHERSSRKQVFRIKGHRIRGWRCPVKACTFEILHPKDADASLRLSRALYQYRMGRVSTGKAAEMADLYYDEMIDEIRKNKIPLRFGPSSFREAEREGKQLVEQLKQLLTARKRRDTDANVACKLLPRE